MVEAERQKRESEDLVQEKNEEEQEIIKIFDKINKNDERIRIIQEQHGSSLEIQSEIERLKMLNKNYQNEIKEKNKKLSSLEKQTKKKVEVQRKVDRERARLAELERERNLIEERLNSTKALD